jgi:hypothetical protein
MVRAHVFTHTGVKKVSLKDALRIDILDTSVSSCGLVNMSRELMEIPSQFRPSKQRLGRIVVVTSPIPDRVEAFKEHDTKMYHMPTWGWNDLYCAGSEQRLQIFIIGTNLQLVIP